MNRLTYARHPWASLRVAWILKQLKNEAIDFSFYILLQALRLLTVIDKDFGKKHLADFECSFSFSSREPGLDGSVAISNGSMSVSMEENPDAEVRVEARSAQEFLTFFMGPNPDLFRAMVDGVVSYEGNLNALLRFIYIARDAKTFLSLAE